jgi:class 3 adenylate cyclase/CheY-like chemotaxis protein
LRSKRRDSTTKRFDDGLVLSDDDAPVEAVAPPAPDAAERPWAVLIADDDEGVHSITRVVLDGAQFKDRPLELLSAYSAAEAKKILLSRPDIAVLLLDVVMEREDAGLALAREIRESIKNHTVRIILRTGQPGQAPEREVILNYDVNDYKSKAELTAQSLFSATISAIRGFSDITALEQAHRKMMAVERAVADRLEQVVAERTVELREALDHQTAIAEVMQVINSSPGDLVPVFDAMLEKALSLCNASFGSLSTREGNKIRMRAARNLPPAWCEYLDRELPDLDPHIFIGRALRDRRVIHVPDILREVEPYGRGVPLAVELAGARTMLWVPLVKHDSALGVLTIYRTEVRPFTQQQIALLQNFAAQAVIAMENARLLGELRERSEEVAELNRGLEARVAEQVEELGRVGRLKRFLAPQLAELIVSQGNEKILESHRREIVVVFCDLRGYTAFTETAEPEEVLDFLREYHGALGPLVEQFEGTLDQFSGDGIMVFFNDPVPIADPAERAVKMAMAMREAAGKLIAAWRRHGCELGFGAGIAQGYATLGQIGFSERSGYTAIGTVCNLAARLCAEAEDGQILVSSRIAGAVEAMARLAGLGNLELKGLRRPVAAFNVVQSTSPAEARPNLTVVARGPGA